MLTDAQKEALKELKDNERTELLEALGTKQSDDSLAKTVEVLQGEVAALTKAMKRKGTEERRKPTAGPSWFDKVFGGS